MCGIAGALVFDGSDFRISQDYLVRMRDTMKHRGPDGGGHWISQDGRVGFAHRRLAIIDLSTAANQPMSNDDGSIHMIFNGEIYNHAEIRRELQQLGIDHWKTDHSDTEVILRAFEQWRIECLGRFRGMFAIAIWDSRSRNLWLIRDRVGIKPLYYSIHHGRCTFASEIKALLLDPEQKREVNEEGLFNYLSFLASPAPQTLFRGIHKLEPGTWVRISDEGRVSNSRYWDAWDATPDLRNVSDHAIAERLLDELKVAVRLRKVSDVPVGVFLSGGIDSSTNAVLFSEGESTPIRTFSIGYEGKNASYVNELDHARRMAARVGADHRDMLISQADILSFLPQMVKLQDEPIGDPVCVPIYYVAKLARESGVIVCQLGEGADELFWGYPTWKSKLTLQRLIDRFSGPGFLGLKSLAEPLTAVGGGHRMEALRRAAKGLPIFWGGVDAFTDAQKRSLLSDRLRRSFRSYSSWKALNPIRGRFEDKAWEKSPLQWMSYLDLNLRLPELLLMRVDKMTMGVSLEGRVPFLDHKVVELALGIPESVKTRGGDLKYILKKAVQGVIPDEVITRPKKGFGVPLDDWYHGELRRQASDSLTQFTSTTDYLDKSAILDLLERGKGQEVWPLLNLALWWKEYVAS